MADYVMDSLALVSDVLFPNIRQDPLHFTYHISTTGKESKEIKVPPNSGELYYQKIILVPNAEE